MIGRHGASFSDEFQLKLKTSLPFVPWNPFPVDVWRGDDTICLPSMRKTNRACVTACSNSNRFIPLVKRWAENARTLLNAGAFSHWFEKHGCEGDQIRAAIRSVEEMMENYQDLWFAIVVVFDLVLFFPIFYECKFSTVLTLFQGKKVLLGWRQ